MMQEARVQEVLVSFVRWRVEGEMVCVRWSDVIDPQNTMEMEGTYPLPEAQLDRFLFKLRVRYPAVEELNAIIDRTTQVHAVSVERVMSGPAVLGFRELIREVPLASHVRDFAS